MAKRKRTSPWQQEKLSFKERMAALKNLPAFFRFIWKVNPAMTTANALLRIVKAVLPLVMLYVGKLIIDEVVRMVNLGEADDMSLLFSLLAAELGLAIASDLLNRGIMLLDALLGDLVSNRSSVLLMEHAAKLDLDQFEDAEFYDMLERARRNTVSRTMLMSNAMSQAQDIITIITLAGGLLAFNPWLMVILVVSVIPSFLGENYFNEQSYSLVRNFTPERRELDYLRYVGASDETAKELKMFGLSGFFIDRFRFLSDKFYLQNKSLSIRRAGWGVLLSTIGSLGYYAAYVFIVIDTVAGILSIGDLTFLTGTFMRLRGLFEGVLNRFSRIAQDSLYLKDFFDFFELQPRIVRGQRSISFPQPIQEGFVFENVSFRYQNTEHYAVRNLSFTLKAGEKLALVGENGAGKTTITKLLARLYDPSEGRILLDGIDLRDYDPDDLRRNTGVIFQDFVRYYLTAGVNIAIGQIAEKENRPLITHAAEQSLADQVIDGLPGGYDQMIGRRFSDGVDLSGGQWQKIALGRAYMRDAQLLILDEPTAALDARSEYEVFQRFSSLTAGKTAVLISHRFSTVRMADRILVLDKGQLHEIGTHEELLSKGGKYAELFELQAQGYQ